MKKHTWTIVFTSCLLAFTVFLAMDTFVLSSAYQTDATGMNTEMFQEAEIKVSKADEDQEDQEVEEDDESEDESSEDTSGSSSKNTSESDSEDASGSDADSNEDADRSEDADSSEDSEDDSDSDSDSGSHRKKPGSSSSGGGPGSSPGGPGSGTGGPGGHGGSGSSDSSDSSSKSKPGSSSKSAGSSSFDEEEAAEEAAAVTTDNEGSSETYEDENVKITYTQYTTNGTTIHVADVQLSSAEYLKTAFAEDTYGKNVTAETSEIAEAHDAILAINGDYYGVQEKGYVIRNGIVYRDEAGDSEVLCIYADGSMKIVDPSTVTAQELVDQGVWQAFSFGPGLVEDGEISVSLDSEVGRARASNPRTAIGIIDDLHYVFLVSDGRSDDSEGLSLYELASFMEQLGVQTAYNLDGGGSSTMVFQNEIINNPTGGFGESERKVSDIVYIG